MKTILITGATSGIGEALATVSAQRGYKVIACGRNPDKLKALESTPNITTLAFDVTDEAGTKSALVGVDADAYVLNAGVCEYVDLDTFEPEMFKRVFDANFFGVVNCFAGILPNLVRGNQVMVVDSLARLLPFTRAQAYGASKAAVHYLTKSMEVDLQEQGVAVTSVSPGFVDTPLTQKNTFDMPSMVTPEESANSILSGFEGKTRSVYYPFAFSAMLRLMNLLPESLQLKICRHLSFEN